MFEEKFHGSDGVVKIPIHSADHEYLGSLSGKLGFCKLNVIFYTYFDVFMLMTP